MYAAASQQITVFSRAFYPKIGQQAACCFKLAALALLLMQAVLLVGIGATNAVAQPKVGPNYIINPGDTLTITTWREGPEKQSALVGPDGMISVPLAGHIKAAGRTSKQVEAIIKRSLTRSRYYENPVIVSVSIAGTGGSRIFVIGQVPKPGAYSLNQPMTVVQALSLAGGITPFGKEARIIIIRKTKTGQRYIKFDYSKVKEGTALDTNIALQNGDVVVVPD